MFCEEGSGRHYRDPPGTALGPPIRKNEKTYIIPIVLKVLEFFLAILFFPKLLERDSDTVCFVKKGQGTISAPSLGLPLAKHTLLLYLLKSFGGMIFQEM